MTKICYYGDKLSTNMAVTPEGFLICRNVPIARTGYQHYLESELIEDGDPKKIINVYRSPSEVFSAATLASFEGKPVTDGHPDVDVTPDNYQLYQKGHVQHVRLGSGDDEDKIIADLYITDKVLINEIRNGKREVSAGYYAEDKEDNQGRICQTKIRGNHVAVVDEGRAGPSVAIRDAKHKSLREEDMATKKEIAEIVSKYLKDATPENIKERFRDAAEVLSDACNEDEDISMDEDLAVDEDLVDEDVAVDEDVVGEKVSADEGGDVGAELKATLAQLQAILSKLGGASTNEAMNADEDVNMDEDINDEDLSFDEDIEDEDVLDEDIEDGEYDIGDEDVEDEDVEDEDAVIPMDEEPATLSASDSAIKIISNAANKIKDKRDRKMVQDAILKATRKKSQMPNIMKLVKANKERRDSASSASINVEKIQKIYDRLDPHKNNKK